MDAKRLQQIREWYSRHRNDYDHKSLSSPPKVWSEYFNDLLREAIEAAEKRETGDFKRRAAGETEP